MKNRSKSPSTVSNGKRWISISPAAHRWFYIYQGFEIDPDEVGQIEEADNEHGMYRVHWPAHHKTVWVPMAIARKIK